MADEDALSTDFTAHVRTYESFIKLAKFGSTAVIIVLILMAFFLL